MNPPCIKPTDAAKYRQQYESNLVLQAANNQKNLNANLILKQTGQTPNPLTDYRTTTEKAADIEGMVKEVRSFISSAGFCNSTESNEVARELAPAELYFVMTYKILIAEGFKGRGVPAATLVAYIRKLMRKTQQTQGVDYGLQQETGEAILLSSQQVLSQMPSQGDITSLRATIQTIGRRMDIRGSHMETLIEAIARDLNAMSSAIPNADDFQKMDSLPTPQRAEIQQLLNSALRDIPTKNDLNNKLNQLFIALNANDAKRTHEVLADLNQILDLNKEIFTELLDIKELIRQAIAEMASSPKSESLPTASASARPTSPVKVTHADIVPPTHFNRKVSPEEIKEKGHLTRGEWENLSHKARSFFLRKKIDTGELTKVGKTTITNTRASNTGDGSELDINRYYDIYDEEQGEKKPSAGEGHGLTGCGLVKTKTKTKQIDNRNRNHSSNGTVDGVVVKPPSYTPFGRYVLNKRKLQDNILMLHRANGGVVKDFPSHKVSPNLGKILRGLTGGVIPHVDHINGLSIPEQEHLHKIVTAAHIDNVPVQTPQIDSKEKENQRFEILKGEIQAGNDNKTLVREFKVLLLRFIQQGRIPRREGHEILVDLTAMGF